VLVHFPVALLFFAFFLDVIAWRWKSQSARMAALYSLVAGVVGTALSVASGLVTPEASEREGGQLLGGSLSLHNFFSGRLVEVHKHWGYVLLALVVLWLAVRVLVHMRPPRWQGLAMSIGLLALIALLLTGYYGGDLVYGRRRGGQIFPLPGIAQSAELRVEHIFGVRQILRNIHRTSTAPQNER
jgi:uncharacterized membrane protein